MPRGLTVETMHIRDKMYALIEESGCISSAQISMQMRIPYQKVVKSCEAMTAAGFLEVAAIMPGGSYWRLKGTAYAPCLSKEVINTGRTVIEQPKIIAKEPTIVPGFDPTRDGIPQHILDQFEEDEENDGSPVEYDDEPTDD